MSPPDGGRIERQVHSARFRVHDPVERDTVSRVERLFHSAVPRVSRWRENLDDQRRRTFDGSLGDDPEPDALDMDEVWWRGCGDGIMMSSPSYSSYRLPSSGKAA